MRLASIVIVIFLFFSNNLIGQDAFCKYWYVEPLLYNNQISDSARVEYWENYWYYKSGDNNKLIPDSLKIVLNLIPSITILPEENFIDGLNTKYRLKSTLIFKYGVFDRSHNVIMPKVSDTIELLNEDIDLKTLYNRFVNTNEMGVSYYPEAIKIKEVLDSLNISIEDGSWDFEKRGKPYALNQIIITTFFIDNLGKKECLSEFTLPINGAYNNQLEGKWEY